MAESYTVTGQKQVVTQTGSGWGAGMEVSFTTARGEAGSVVLPLTTYSADAVKQAIEQRVAVMDEVAQL